MLAVCSLLLSIAGHAIDVQRKKSHMASGATDYFVLQNGHTCFCISLLVTFVVFFTFYTMFVLQYQLAHFALKFHYYHQRRFQVQGVYLSDFFNLLRFISCHFCFVLS